jgi:formate hydrogenlyase transcriptional activator
MPLGSLRPRRVDVRVIAATNRDVRTMLEEKEFRSDLYFRLSVFPIKIPPLRDRIEDVPDLIRYFVKRKQRTAGCRANDVDPGVFDLLKRYDWPGNIRELENVIERALILSSGSRIETNDVRGALPLRFESPENLWVGEPITVQENERRFLLDALRATNWKIKGPGNAAERVGLAPSTLRGRMSRLGIVRPTKTHRR